MKEISLLLEPCSRRGNDDDWMHSFLQQTQRPDLARLMQIHASAATGLPPGPAGLPPGLLGGPGGPGGLPSSIALLAGLPASLGQPGPHPAFASLLAQQKPNPDPSIRSKDEELKRAIADTNGSKCQTSLLFISWSFFTCDFVACFLCCVYCFESVLSLPLSLR